MRDLNFCSVILNLYRLDYFVFLFFIVMFLDYFCMMRKVIDNRGGKELIFISYNF